MQSYLENFVEALFPWSKPGGGKSSLGICTTCTWCDGRGYLKKNANVWRACPECYGGHFWIRPSPGGEELAESAMSASPTWSLTPSLSSILQSSSPSTPKIRPQTTKTPSVRSLPMDSKSESRATPINS